MTRTVRFIAGAIALVLGIAIFSSCADGNVSTTEIPETDAPIETTEITTEEITTEEVGTTEAETDNYVSLDGKKVVIIGNSMIYYGGVVTQGNQRRADTGVFYRICRANGEKVTVYDCTYGNHSLSDFTTAGCKTSGCDVGVGGDLLSGIDLDSIDYVLMSEAGKNNSSIVNDIKKIMARFKNEKTQFFYLCHTYSYTKGHTSLTGNLPRVQAIGVGIVDWGHLCYDVYKGTAKVPGGTLTYSKNTFVNHTASDPHHPNILAGYVQSLMAYCAITGRSAVGQDYSFRTSVQYGSGSVSYTAYLKKYYTDGETSNFMEVFESQADMTGLQTLMDEYLGKWKLGVNGK